MLARFLVPVGRVVLLPPRSVKKTSSGKLRRAATRDALLDGQLPVVFQSDTAECRPNPATRGSTGPPNTPATAPAPAAATATNAATSGSSPRGEFQSPLRLSANTGAGAGAGRSGGSASRRLGTAEKDEGLAGRADNDDVDGKEDEEEDDVVRSLSLSALTEELFGLLAEEVALTREELRDLAEREEDEQQTKFDEVNAQSERAGRGDKTFYG